MRGWKKREKYQRAKKYNSEAPNAIMCPSMAGCRMRPGTTLRGNVLCRSQLPFTMPSITQIARGERAEIMMHCYDISFLH